MATQRLRPFGLACAGVMALWVLIAYAEAGRAAPAIADEIKLPAALLKPNPENIEDLRAIEAHVKTIVAKVMPAVVNVKPEAKGGGGQGSGVVISEDGYVLTAAHVAPTPDKLFVITFPDGKQAKAKSLGSNGKQDDGMLKITEEGKYPHCEIGKSSDLQKGQWCIAIGHPGGLKPGRTPPVRVGRINAPPGTWVTTEAVLVGGDSGGPLFDMYGKVIGIHSRIGNPLTANMHVPVDQYKTDWERMVAGERWGNPPGGQKGQPTSPAWLGIQNDPEYAGQGIKIGAVLADSPASKAGLMVNDVIVGVNSKRLADFEELRSEIGRRKAGDEVTLEIRRSRETLQVKVTLDKAPQ
jgi:serine protease Do